MLAQHGRGVAVLVDIHEFEAMAKTDLFTLATEHHKLYIMQYDIAY
jgi:hypothetical protein